MFHARFNKCGWIFSINKNQSVLPQFGLYGFKFSFLFFPFEFSSLVLGLFSSFWLNPVLIFIPYWISQGINKVFLSWKELNLNKCDTQADLTFDEASQGESKLLKTKLVTVKTLFSAVRYWTDSRFIDESSCQLETSFIES